MATRRTQTIKVAIHDDDASDAAPRARMASRLSAFAFWMSREPPKSPDCERYPHRELNTDLEDDRETETEILHRARDALRQTKQRRRRREGASEPFDRGFYP